MYAVITRFEQNLGIKDLKANHQNIIHDIWNTMESKYLCVIKEKGQVKNSKPYSNLYWDILKLFSLWLMIHRGLWISYISQSLFENFLYTWSKLN